jgi:hypothetical protein
MTKDEAIERVIAFRAITMMPIELSEAIDLLIQHIRDTDKWRLALENLTPLGSEYHNDLERCVEYIRNRYDLANEERKELVRLRRRVQALALKDEAAK